MEEEDTGDQSSPSLPELARAEQVMAQSTTVRAYLDGLVLACWVCQIHYSWDWALEDAIAPKEEALRVVVVVVVWTTDTLVDASRSIRD